MNIQSSRSISWLFGVGDEYGVFSCCRVVVVVALAPSPSLAPRQSPPTARPRPPPGPAPLPPDPRIVEHRHN